jgi:hypothetical protein
VAPQNFSSRQTFEVCLTTVRILWVLWIAPALALAQNPHIGAIDFYGVHTVSEARIRQALGFREGAPLPSSKAEVEERLEKVPGVVLARLEAVCCNGDRAILYVGIEERGAPHFEYRPPAEGETKLPDAVADTYREFPHALEGVAPGGRQRFVDLAGANLERVEQVLRESSDAEQRVIAGNLLGYAHPSRGVASALQYGMRDADESVRAQSARSLAAVAVAASSSPDLGIRVQPTWFIEMLNSLVWSDRESAAAALAAMTESRDESVLSEIRERALPAVIEMARWKTANHARPAFLLAGRLAGVAEKEIQAAWARGDRNSVLRRLSKGAASRGK